MSTLQYILMSGKSNQIEKTTEIKKRLNTWIKYIQLML